jgi:protein-disulfide isomerase
MIEPDEQIADQLPDKPAESPLLEEVTQGEVPPRAGSISPVWFWVFVALVGGGLVGWAIGRQMGMSAAAAPVEVTSVRAAATVTLVPADVVENQSASVTLIGPTPASIRPETRRTLGDPNAPVTIVEFSDYQCPFCRRHADETLPQLKVDYIKTGRVYYVFKDFPIGSLHPLAYRQHEAALCVLEAAGSDGYWQVHDLFFSDPERFAVGSVEAIDAVLLTVLEEAGLPDISECLASETYSDAVQADLDEGQSLGVNGTPAFFINGYPITGAQPYELFEYAIGLAEEGKLQDAYEQPAAPAPAAATSEPNVPLDIIISDEPSKGSVDAPITIVEFSDYQCPYCQRHFEQTMPQLQQYIDAGQVRYVFKDFPLRNIHPQAQKAHESARCAREIGGDAMYWTMHDLLFSRQAEWSQVQVPGHEVVLKSLAAEAGLPQDAFDECLDSGRYYDAVDAELDEGTRLGVRGTPAFFINGLSLAGAQPFTVFQQAIEQILGQS